MSGAVIGGLPASFLTAGAVYQNIDPVLLYSVTTAGGGSIQLIAVKGSTWYQAIYISNVTSPTTAYVNVQIVGSAHTCYVGLYNATTLLGSGSFTANTLGTKSVTLTAQSAGSLTNLAAGVYFIGLLSVNTATTAPTMLASGLININSITNFGPNKSTANSLVLQSSSLGTGLTTLATSIVGTPSTTLNNGNATMWCALS